MTVQTGDTRPMAVLPLAVAPPPGSTSRVGSQGLCPALKGAVPCPPRLAFGGGQLSEGRRGQEGPLVQGGGGGGGCVGR